MARSPSVKPTKTNEEEEARAETEVNQEDPNAETPINPLESSTDWDLAQDDDEEVDWDTSDESRSTNEEDFLLNGDSRPIGVLLSVKGKQVIVKGEEKDNFKLVKKGSFLWLPVTREPLGFVDEIFGTLEEPCYSLRLKSERKLFGSLCGQFQVSLIVSGSLQHDKKVCDEYISSGDDDDDHYDSGLGNTTTRQDIQSQPDSERHWEAQPNLDSEEWPDLASNPETPTTRSQSLHNRGLGRGGRGFFGGRGQHFQNPPR